MAKKKYTVTDRDGYSEQYRITYLDHMKTEDIDLDAMFPPRTENELQAIRDEVRARAEEKHGADIDTEVVADLTSRRAPIGYNAEFSDQYNIAYIDRQPQSE